MGKNKKKKNKHKKRKNMTVYSFKKSLQRINLETKGKVFIPEYVLNKINYLCKHISSTEWSAVLFYKVTKGSLDKMADMEIEIVDLYLQDIGTSTFTSFTNDVDLIDIYDEKEELEDCRIGSIHSHNTMTAFYSGTDLQDMEDNCQIYNIYLSIVVNNRGEKVAKIAVPMSKTVSGKTTTSFSIKDDKGKVIELEDSERVVDDKEEAVLMMDFDITEEVETVPFDKSFVERVKDLVTRKAAPTYEYKTWNERMNEEASKESKSEIKAEIKAGGVIDKKTPTIFLERYLSCNGTDKKIKIREVYMLYGPLFELSKMPKVEDYLEECDKHMFDILEEYEKNGYDKVELIEAAIEDLEAYKMSYKKESALIKESLEAFALHYFTAESKQ